ncbi:MAG: hypothetical protein U0W65_15370 [Bacteroidia bacterium]
MRNYHYIIFTFLLFNSIDEALACELNTKTQKVLHIDSERIKELINKTAISINKAQKEMIAGNDIKKTLELTSAVRYQVLAVDAFKKNDLKAATFFSTKAREFSNAILIQRGIKGIDFYKLSEDETSLIKSYNYTSNDGLFSNIVIDSIEDAILFDPEKLTKTFLLTIY